MSIADLKEKLFQQIKQSDNDELLEEVYRILELGSYDKTEYPLNDDLKKSILQGKEDYKQGNVVSNEEAQKEFAQWATVNSSSLPVKPFTNQELEVVGLKKRLFTEIWR